MCPSPLKTWNFPISSSFDRGSGTTMSFSCWTFNWMSCNVSHVSADSKGLHLSWITWNFRTCSVPLRLMCTSYTPIGFIVEPPNSFNLTEEFFIGGSPNCVMAERSSKLCWTLLVYIGNGCNMLWWMMPKMGINILVLPLLVSPPTNGTLPLCFF